MVADPWGTIFALYKPGSAPPPQTACPLHGFSWNEVSADDLEASWKFYQDLFGWEVMQEFDMGPEMGPYRIYGRLGFQLGGMYKRPPQMPVNAIGVYILVEDVDEDAEAGGSGRRQNRHAADGRAGRRPDRRLPGSSGHVFLPARQSQRRSRQELSPPGLDGQLHL